MRELFGYKTLDTKEAHSSLSKKTLLKTCLEFPLYTKRNRYETLNLFGLELLFGLN